MTFAFDKPVIIGKTVLTVLCENRVTGHGSTQRTLITGSKMPVALLLQRDDQLTILNPDGDTMTLDEVETLCPGMMSVYGR